MSKKHKDNYINDMGLIFVIAAVLFFILLIVLYPHVTDASSNEKLVMYWEDERIIFIKYNNYDESKSTDIFKNNPKTLYVLKELTLQDYIWQYLTDEMGLSDVAAAGIFGNMMVECGSHSFNLQPFVYSPGGGYYGLCQWSTSNHHSGINGGTVEQQLGYLCGTIESEMGSNYYERFIASVEPESASVIFARWYERCSDPYGRQQEARRAYERYGG